MQRFYWLIGRKVDIVETMIQKLEAYANNLEDMIERRTTELIEEKDKTDKLLYRMLPRSGSMSLRRCK